MYAFVVFIALFKCVLKFHFSNAFPPSIQRQQARPFCLPVFLCSSITKNFNSIINQLFNYRAHTHHLTIPRIFITRIWAHWMTRHNIHKQQNKYLNKHPPSPPPNLHYPPWLPLQNTHYQVSKSWCNIIITRDAWGILLICHTLQSHTYGAHIPSLMITNKFPPFQVSQTHFQYKQTKTFGRRGGRGGHSFVIPGMTGSSSIPG